MYFYFLSESGDFLAQGHLPPDSDDDDDVIMTSTPMTFDLGDSPLVEIFKLKLFDGDM